MLTPYRVLDLTGTQGALAGYVLAALGAEVVAEAFDRWPILRAVVEHRVGHLGVGDARRRERAIEQEVDGLIDRHIGRRDQEHPAEPPRQCHGAQVVAARHLVSGDPSGSR